MALGGSLIESTAQSIVTRQGGSGLSGQPPATGAKRGSAEVGRGYDPAVRFSLLVAAAVVALAGCASEPETKTVTVYFQLVDFDTAFLDCEGTGGYSDIGPGTPVTLRNGEGEVLGAEPLGDGQPSGNGVQAAFCDWTVEIPNVPANEKFYAVEVGDRGDITASREDLAADRWEFAVSLGD